MAVKKVAKKEEVKDTPITIEEEVTIEETVEDTVEEEQVEVDAVPEVEVTTEDTAEPEVEVDTQAVKDETVTSKNVRIRAKRDHRCFIGGELYDLKEGMCYNVPEFVKNTLNRAGILSPL